jgi:hypothetical protein
MKNIIIILLTFTFLMPAGFAADGFKQLLQDYHYDMTVLWDQEDQEALRSYEQKLRAAVLAELKAGREPQELIDASLELIPDESMRSHIANALKLYQLEKMSKEQLTQVIIENSQQMGAQGSSWHPVVKVLVGIAIAYVALKLIMLAIYFSDTDPNYGQPTGGNPPKP